MTEAQKKEFASVLMRDYGVQIGKDDEILPILHLMYQMVFHYKRIVDEQQQTVKDFDKMLSEKLGQMETLLKQAQQKNEQPPPPPAPEKNTLKIFGKTFRAGSLTTLNDFLAFFLFVELIIAAIFLIIRYS